MVRQFLGQFQGPEPRRNALVRMLGDFGGSAFQNAADILKDLYEKKKNQKILDEIRAEGQRNLSGNFGGKPVIDTARELSDGVSPSQDATSEQIDSTSIAPTLQSDREAKSLASTAAQLKAIKHPAAESYQKMADERQQRTRDVFKAEYPAIMKEVEELPKKWEAMEKKEEALRHIEDSIEEGIGPATLDYLADMTGIEAFRGAAGAKLKTAQKELLISTVGKVSARAMNQWLEKQVDAMFPKIGRQAIANKVSLEMLKAEMGTEKERLRIKQNIINRAYEEGREIPRNLNSIVEKEVAKYREREKDRAFYNIQDYYEKRLIKDLGSKGLEKALEQKAFHNPVLTPRAAQYFLNKYGAEKGLSVAKKLGYRMISEERLNDFAGE